MSNEELSYKPKSLAVDGGEIGHLIYQWSAAESYEEMSKVAYEMKKVLEVQSAELVACKAENGYNLLVIAAETKRANDAIEKCVEYLNEIAALKHTCLQWIEQ